MNASRTLQRAEAQTPTHEPSVVASEEAAPASTWVDRDLSWLEFNRRVLAEALDDRTPLLERAKFLAIFSVEPRRVLHEADRRAARERHAGAPAAARSDSRSGSLPMLQQQARLLPRPARPGAVAARHPPAAMGRAERGAAAGSRRLLRHAGVGGADAARHSSRRSRFRSSPTCRCRWRSSSTTTAPVRSVDARVKVPPGLQPVGAALRRRRAG